MFNLYYPSIQAELENLKAAKSQKEKQDCVYRIIDLWRQAGTYSLDQLKLITSNDYLLFPSPEEWVRVSHKDSGKELARDLKGVLDYQITCFVTNP